MPISQIFDKLNKEFGEELDIQITYYDHQVFRELFKDYNTYAKNFELRLTSDDHSVSHFAQREMSEAMILRNIERLGRKLYKKLCIHKDSWNTVWRE